MLKAYLVYLVAVGLAIFGVKYFHIFSVADFFAFLAVWCGGYLMSYVVKG